MRHPCGNESGLSFSWSSVSVASHALLHNGILANVMYVMSHSAACKENCEMSFHTEITIARWDILDYWDSQMSVVWSALAF